MITAASLTNIDTADSKSFVVGVSGSASGGGVTLESITPSYETEVHNTRKHQTSGEWNNYVYVRRLVLTLRGKIVGADASGYITQRNALVKAFLPDEGEQTERNHTTLALTFSNSTSVSDACVFESFDAPFTVEDSPIAAEYTLVLVNRTGYFHSGATAYKL